MRLKRGFSLRQPELELSSPEQQEALRECLIIAEELVDRHAADQPPAPRMGEDMTDVYDRVKRAVKSVSLGKHHLDTASAKELESMNRAVDVVERLRETFDQQRWS